MASFGEDSSFWQVHTFEAEITFDVCMLKFDWMIEVFLFLLRQCKCRKG